MAVTSTPVFQWFHRLRSFLAHVIVKCRSEGCVEGVLWEADAQTKWEVPWERKRGAGAEKSRTGFPLGARLTRVKERGREEEGGRGVGTGAALRKARPDHRSSRFAHSWVLCWPEIVSRCSTTVLRRGSGLPARSAAYPKHTVPGGSQLARLPSLWQLLLKWWCPSVRATGIRGWGCPLFLHPWSLFHSLCGWMWAQSTHGMSCRPILGMVHTTFAHIPLPKTQPKGDWGMWCPRVPRKKKRAQRSQSTDSECESQLCPLRCVKLGKLLTALTLSFFIC